MEIIAHRGFSSQYPENSRIAIAQAIELPIEWVEIDLRRSKDGHWVVIHDASLKERFGLEGCIEDHDLTRLKEMSYGAWFSPEYENERILTLKEVCELILPKKGLILDVKTQGDFQEIAQSLQEQIPQENRSRIVLSTFLIGQYRSFQRIIQGVQYGFLFSKWTPFFLFFLSGLKAFSIHPRLDQWNMPLCLLARIRAWKVFVWTVNDWSDMKKLQRSGVNAIFTDYPDKAILFRDSLDENESSA